MANKNVKLKNLNGDYLYPYTDNIPTGSASVAGKVKVDSVPTSGSDNAISSGAVHTALAGKLGTTETAAKAAADANGDNIINTYLKKNENVTSLATSGTIALVDNSVNRITPTDAVTFSLPTITDHAVFHQILVQMNLTAAYAINLGASTYFAEEAPAFEIGYYDIIYEHNGSSWVVGAIKKG